MDDRSRLPEEPGPASPGAPEPSGKSGYRAKRRAAKARRTTLRRRLTRSGIAVVLIVVVLVAAIVGYSAYRLGQITVVPGGQNLTPTSKTGGAENILLIGSTNRCAATKIKVFVQECQQGVNGINSDVVMVLRIVPATHRLTLLSIPRDTFVPDARTGGLYNKIDAALYDGPGQLAAAITQDFGIPINHFVELNFGSFENVVNALGGISMYFPDRLYDAESPPLDIMQTGCVHLNGSEALALVRSRHEYYFHKGQKPNLAAIQAATASGVYYTPASGGSFDGSGDLGRITRVHEFLKVLASAVSRRGLSNPLTDNALLGAIAPDLVVDSTFGDSEMLHLGLDLRSANLSSAPELTAPIIVNAATYYYKGYNYGDVVFPTEPQDQQAVNAFLGYTPPGWKLRPASITVSVIDGTGSSTSTAASAARLHALGYPIVATTATNVVGPVSETTVLYAKGHLQQAERVMSSLSGTVVLGQGTPAAGADVSVIAGSDLAVASPGAAHATTAAALTSATTASSSTANPNFGAPTSPSPSIAPWDPRACGTTGK